MQIVIAGLQREARKIQGALEERRAMHEETKREHADDRRTLDRIATLLDGAEWNSETCSEVADVIRSTGRRVGEVAS